VFVFIVGYGIEVGCTMDIFSKNMDRNPGIPWLIIISLKLYIWLVVTGTMEFSWLIYG
jgi:hypothetical protein